MLNTEISIRRTFALWQEFSAKSVEIYLKELNEMKEKLKAIGWDYQRSLFGSKDLLEKLENSLGTEISYCNFFKEYLTRRLEANFDLWVFTKKEDIKTLYEWKKPQGDQWTKTNGRVKATIQLDRSGAMVKISLEFENDSLQLQFLEHKECQPCHVKTESSIAEKVQAFKTYADAFMKEHEMPRYCSERAEYDILQKLLCVEGT